MNSIQKINNLQDLVLNYDLELNLPQLIVIGSQSCGKTSVLEQIIEKDILPRGTGIVTRCPIVIQLISSDKEYAIFNDSPNNIITSDEEIRLKLLRKSQEIKNISEIPIILKLYGSYLNLTLIDLPGLIKIATNDQPPILTKKIYNLVKEYASNPNAILLAVTSANTDLSNSDALQLAAEVDPTYDRTVGILTKVDLMDKSTDVVDILANKIITLKRGYCPLVCRSQSQINSKISLKEGLVLEQKFFETHKSYQKNSKYCGSVYLKNKLHNMLIEHIKKVIPNLIDKIKNMENDFKLELKNIILNLSPKENCIRIINDFLINFNNILKGNTNNNELIGGARILFSFNNIFYNNLESIKFDLKDDKIRTLLYNVSSIDSYLNTYKTFEILAKKEIENFRPVCLKLVNLVYEEILKLAYLIIESPYKEFNIILKDYFKEYFLELKNNCIMLINKFIDWNINYIKINFKVTTTSNFSKKKDSFLPNILKLRGEFTNSEKMEIENIKEILFKYNENIKEILNDQIPKLLMSEMVLKSDNLNGFLFSKIFNKENLESLFVEDEDVIERRNYLKSKIELLKEAYEIICSI